MPFMRPARAAVVLYLVLSGNMTLPPAAAQSSCSESDARAVLSPTDNAYPHAVELSALLSRHGFVVQCVATSTAAGLFEGQHSAATYRTNAGDFSALFLSKSDTFASLKINEGSANGLFVYTFDGTPRPWPANRMEGRRTYFVRGANRLLLVRDKALADRLQSALSAP